MSIIYPQAVETIVNTNTANYYKSKGYVIPMRYSKRSKKMIYDYGAIITVDASDLLPNSNVKVKCTCDNCGDLIITAMNNYTLRFTNPPKPQYCKKCSPKIYLSGNKSPHWNPSLSDNERINQRHYPEYKDFVKKVLVRDNYICQHCGMKISDDGVVHHLDGYGWCIDKRTDVTNGITLCGDCHNLFHALYGMKNNTKEQFEEWMGCSINLSDYDGSIYRLPKVYCIEDNIIYNDYYEVAKAIGCHPASVSRTCTGKSKTLHGKHYIYYEKYLCMTEDEIQNILSYRNDSFHEDTRLICLTTGDIFHSVTNAVMSYNISKTSIYRNLSGMYKHGGRKNNIQLQWLWYTDFTALPPHEQLQIALDNKETLQEGSFLYELLYYNDKKDLFSPTSQTLSQPSAQ